MTRVSIVIPCFNGGDMVRDAIASAIGQTHEDVEIIVVNDGSTDAATLAALERADRFDGLRVINQENRGLPLALNRGIHESSGAYVIPLAHDDEFYPTYVAKAAALLDDRSEVGIVYCRAERFGASVGEWELLDFDMGRMLVDNLIFACAMYRRQDWEAVGGYSKSMSRGFEDHDFWLKLLTLGREVERIDEVLFRYRDTYGSLSNTMVTSDRIAAFSAIFSANADLYVRHAREFAEVMIGQQEMLRHFKQRYGRIEDQIARLGELRRKLQRRPRSVGISLVGRRSGSRFQ